MAWKSFFVATLSIGLALTPPAGAQGFIANLSAGQTVPRANSQASGSCSAVLLEEDLELSISCEHNAENVFAAHIHLGAVGEAGPIILPFDDPEEIEGVFELSDEQAAFLLTESFYVNIHSNQSPPGEIRGQLRFQSTQETDGAVFVPLSGGQEVPPVATQASGRCLAELDEEDGGPELSVICHHSVQNPVAAHIHQGSAGDNGPIVVPLGDGASPIVLDDMQVSQEIADAFDAGDLYFNVHSAENPPGELRGQIVGCSEDENTLCLNNGRFQVEATWNDFEGNSGPANATRESLDSGILWFFDPDNAEILIKVLDACNVSPFNSFWVFAASTTNVEYTLTVTDTQTDQVRTYTNELGQAAPAILDTDAFATCP